MNAEEQERRFREQVERGGDEVPREVDLDYIRALSHAMPPTAGMGIGMDRLIMLLTDSHSIREVILFPLLRPEASGHRTRAPPAIRGNRRRLMKFTWLVAHAVFALAQ